MKNDKQLAYEFGRITAIEAKAEGFNMVWGPVVDLIDGVAFVTFCKGGSYVASDGLTNRVTHTMEALSKRIVAVMRVGNPYAMEKIPHVPRIIFGFSGGECEKYAVEILSGKREAKGKMLLKLNLK